MSFLKYFVFYLSLTLSCCFTIARGEMAPNQCVDILWAIEPEVDSASTFLSSTAGIEFEGSIPKHLSFRTIAEAIEADLKQRNPYDRVWIEEEPFGNIESSYHVKHDKNGWIKTYSIKVEGDLNFEKLYEPDVKGLEITSPIMRTEEEVSYFISILDELRSFGLKSRPDKGGIHIHWGVKETETLSNVSNLYKAVYKLIQSSLKHFNFGSDRGEFLNFLSFKSIVDNFAAVAQENPDETLSEGDVEQISKRSLMRYESRYGTIELRLFNSTLNPDLNQFYFEFTQAIFEAWKEGENSELWRYLMNNEPVSFESVLELMGLDVERVMSTLTQANQKLQELESQITHKKRNQLPSQYVMASQIEQFVDDFWSEDHNSQSLSTAIRRFKNIAPEKDLQIGLFNILQHPKFKTLPDLLRQQLFLDYRDLFALEQYVSRELWAIEVALRDDLLESLGPILTNVNTNDPLVGLPLARWIFYRVSDSNFDMYALTNAVNNTPGSLDQLLLLAERHMLISRPLQKEHHFMFFAAILNASNKPLSSMRAINVLNLYTAYFQRSRINLTPLFDEILKKSSRSHRVFLELLRYINNLQLRGSQTYQNVSDPKTLIAQAIYFLHRSNFPQIFNSIIKYVDIQKGQLRNDEISMIFDGLSASLSRMGPGLTNEEISSMSLAYRLSFVKETEIPEGQRLMEQIHLLSE